MWRRRTIDHERSHTARDTGPNRHLSAKWWAGDSSRPNPSESEQLVRFNDVIWSESSESVQSPIPSGLSHLLQSTAAPFVRACRPFVRIIRVSYIHIYSKQTKTRMYCYSVVVTWVMSALNEHIYTMSVACDIKATRCTCGKNNLSVTTPHQNKTEKQIGLDDI